MSKKSRKQRKQMKALQLAFKKQLEKELAKAERKPKKPVKLQAKMYWSLSSCTLLSSNWNGDFDPEDGVYTSPEGYKSWICNDEKYKALEFHFTRHSGEYLIIEFTEDCVYTTQAGAKAIDEYDAYMMDPSTNENVLLFHHITKSKLDAKEALDQAQED